LTRFAQIKITFIVCSILTIFFWGQEYWWAYSNDKETNLISNLTYQAIYHYTWGVLFFGIIWLANKFRIQKNNLLKTVPPHIFFGIVIAFIHRLMSFVPYIYIFYPEKTGDGFITSGVLNKVISGSFDSFLAYFLLLGLYYGYEYYQQYREHLIKARELESQLAQAQLHALKMQLQPHFLFNTMHAISALMDENVKTAQKMLARLSDLLRQTLDNIGVQKVTFQQELDFVKSYLEIELTRFQDRLKVDYEIDNKVLNHKVPNLILQPLVENAIKHGISPKAEGGTVLIIAKSLNDNLELSICDNGKGNGSNEINEGLGIKNTRLRLEKMYKDDYTFEIDDKNEKGFCVTLRIPLED
jgi:two-component system LytT family sensor kinase